MNNRSDRPGTADLMPGQHVHLIGVGGAGMSALAQILLERGVSVSGSDLRTGASTESLRAMGARIDRGHHAPQVDGADLVVISNAVPADNVELGRARAQRRPVILRADLLELLMAGHRRVLISGTHGKTTTTAMTTVALQACGFDPSFAIGGALPASTGAHHGSSQVFVAEADEAFRSFLRLTPDVAVITNLEMDHHDEYADERAYRHAFLQFLDRRPPDGLAILCADDPGSAGLTAAVGSPVTTYGTAPSADIVIDRIVPEPGGGSSFRLTESDSPIAAVTVAAPGRHNVLNATAAILATRWAGGSIAVAAAGLAAFSGALRRFQRIGTVAGVTVVDDYGHHPTELAATLAAARQANPGGRVIAVFQPHRFSRTQAMGEGLGRALAAADVVVVTAIYAAGEDALPGVTGQIVATAAAREGASVQFVDDLNTLAPTVVGLSRPGDMVLTMGAGDITRLGPQILAGLEQRR